MPMTVANPDQMLVSAAYDLFNSTPASELPAATGRYGIDATVWGDLITLTRTKCNGIGIPTPSGAMMTGMCIWASVVAAKFFVHRNHYLHSHVIRVQKSGHGKGSDHYFVVASNGGGTVICDITCNQFTGAPDFIVGTLAEVRGNASKFNAFDGTLYNAYALGAASNTYVI